MSQMRRRPKIGLALGGGGARGIAQKEMLNSSLREKVIQWPMKIYGGLEKRGYRIFKAVSA